MLRSTTLVLGVLLLVFIAESFSQRIILPTYRPPLKNERTRHRPVILRTVRDAGDEPQWLFKGDDVQRAPSTADDPTLPKYIDDVSLDPNRRYARELKTATFRSQADLDSRETERVKRSVTQDG